MVTIFSISFVSLCDLYTRALLSATSDVPDLHRGIVRCKSTPEFCPTGVPGAKPELSKYVQYIHGFFNFLSF